MTDHEAAVYLRRSLRRQAENGPVSQAHVERLIPALPGLCGGFEKGQEKSEVGSGSVGLGSMLLPAVVERLAGLGSGEGRAGLELYLQKIGYEPNASPGKQKEGCGEQHGISLMMIMRGLIELRFHFERCEKAGVSPGGAESWALSEEESGVFIQVSLEKKSLERETQPCGVRERGSGLGLRI